MRINEGRHRKESQIDVILGAVFGAIFGVIFSVIIWPWTADQKLAIETGLKSRNKTSVPAACGTFNYLLVSEQVCRQLGLSLPLKTIPPSLRS